MGFKILQAFLQYMGVNCRQDVRAAGQLIALRKGTVTKFQLMTPRKSIKHVQRSPTQGHNFDKIDMKFLCVIVLSDASFKNALELKGCLIYKILIVNWKWRTKIVQYKLDWCHYIVQSVIATAAHALVHMVG